MSKKRSLLAMMLCLLTFCVSCGQVADEDDPSDGLNGTSFQDNGGGEYNDFVLTEIFTGKGGLEEMWDSIESDGYNARFNKVVDDQVDDFVVFSHIGSNVLSDPSKVIIPLAAGNGGALLDYLLDPEGNYPLRDGENSEEHYFVEDGETYMDGFYSFLDEVFKDGEDPGSVDMVRVNYKVLSRILDKKTPAEIHKDMEDIMEDIRDPDFKDDFIDLTTVLGKLMLRADYPRAGLGLGNGVKGLVDLFMWYNRMEKHSETRALMREQVNELVSLFDPSPDSGNSEKIKTLLKNIVSYFTEDGAVYSGVTVDAAWAAKYGVANIYGHIDGATEDIYSDTELGNTLRELLPGSLQLLMRSDRPHAMIATKDGESPVYLLRKVVDNLKSLGFDPEAANIEQSLLNLMRYDLLGRDRLTDPDAHGISHLENLIFLTHVTSNMGWQDRNIPKYDSSNPETPSNLPTLDVSEISNKNDSRYAHGHGDYTGRLSLNDSLFSIKTHKTFNSMGLFDIGFASNDGEHIHRSRVPFTKDNRSQYNFYFDQNYDVLQCLCPPCLGDLGSPHGGNSDGEALGNNEYRAYSPDGLNENQLASWTLGLIVRSCFNGEGPYYYDDPDADHFMENGKTWYVYKRPNGKIYAYVCKDNPNAWEYFYPVDGEDPNDPAESGTLNGKNVRYNRYKAQWYSEYYLSHHAVGGTDYYKTIDNQSGQVAMVDAEEAGRLMYEEAIGETNEVRACSSSEEALFRNYQWFMAEKKMVLIIPLRLVLDNIPSVPMYQVLEANGLEGLCALRKFKGNHIWAKTNQSGQSFVPGDYRIEVVSVSEDPYNPLGSDNIYDFTLDCGHATPSVVGMNIFALSRLAFPRYTSMTSHGGSSILEDNQMISHVEDRQLGSAEFELGDDTWNNRCALLPPFISLIAVLREYTPSYDQYNDENNNGLTKGIRTFVEGTSPLLKPLIFYQKAEEPGMYPHETWKPRVYGSETAGPSPEWSDFHGDGFLRSSADFNASLNLEGDPDLKASSWNGSDMEQRYYLPAEEKTLLGLLIDSDMKAEPSEDTRMNGVLPVLMENRATTKLLAAVLTEPNDTNLVYSGLEQVNSLFKFSRGRMTEINETNAKNMVYPTWMFVTGDGAGEYGEDVNFTPLDPADTLRDVDIVLDRGLDRVIGHRAVSEALDGYGLVQYVYKQEVEGDNWVDFDDNLDFLEDLLHESSDYSVVTSSLDMNEKVFGRDRLYTEDEISGLIYALGKLMTHYDVASETETWINQGEDGFDDIWTILHDHLPSIHKFMRKNSAACEEACAEAADYKVCLLEVDDCSTGDNYRSALMINKDMLKEDSVVEFLVGTMETNVDWKQVLADASDFLKTDMVTQEKPLWWTLSELLDDLGTAVDLAKDGKIIDSVYDDYGFQKN